MTGQVTRIEAEGLDVIDHFVEALTGAGIDKDVLALPANEVDAAIVGMGKLISADDIYILPDLKRSSHCPAQPIVSKRGEEIQGGRQQGIP